jgi:glycosyltransferase involved in cell wall biosynthesis
MDLGPGGEAIVGTPHPCVKRGSAAAKPKPSCLLARRISPFVLDTLTGEAIISVDVDLRGRHSQTLHAQSHDFDHRGPQGLTRRSRLAFVTHHVNPWWGQDRCTLEIARRLSHHWPVDIYALDFQPGPETDAPDASWGDVRYHRIRPGITRPMLVRSPLFQLATLPRLLAARRTAQPALIHAAGTASLVSDVIQLHYLHAGWQQAKHRMADTAAADGNPKAIPAAMRKTYHRLLLAFDLWRERHCYTRSKTFVAVSHGVARELQAHYGPFDSVHVVHHGVDATAFSPPSAAAAAHRMALRGSLGVSNDEVLVAFVGAYERKGLDTVVDALARLSLAARRRAHLVAVGQGRRDAFLARARRLGIEDRISLSGHTRDISDFYRAADLFVLPTRYEPFGLVILEAMACGLPVVVSRCAGAAELVDESSGRLLEDPVDARELAGLLEPFILDDRLRKTAGEAARELAMQHTWDEAARRYAAVLAPFMRA